jgi:tetrahedral aminopeptidase
MVFNRERLFQRIKRYCELAAPSGFEEAAINEMKNDVKGADSVEVDRNGNVIAVINRKKKNPRVMICAHLDEPGLIIKAIEEYGYLRFDMIGGMVEQHLVGQRVLIHTEQGKSIVGITGVPAAHSLIPKLPPEKFLVPKIGDMYIDVGASSRDEVKQMGIDVGNPVTYARTVEMLGTEQVTGKAFDDRALVVAMLEAFEMLTADPEFDLTVYAVGSVEEEVGLRGARTAAYSISPDLAFVLDITFAKTPDVEYRQVPIIMGQGPAVKFQDFILSALVGHLPHRKARELVIKTAEEKGIQHQREVVHDVATDAGVIQQSKSGVPTATISLPSKYAHSSIETIHLGDFEATIELLYECIKKVSREGFNPDRVL